MVDEQQHAEILWVDDEIDLLKSQIQFLESRGYRVTTLTNGPDAVAMVQGRPFDAVLLDEIMVGMDGIETLRELKAVDASLPVIMVTKSTEETLMDDAYFGEISDFLVKPVNPHQILSSLKKVLDLERLRRNRFVGAWGEYYNQAQAVINDPAATFADWAGLYTKICQARRDIEELNLGALEPLQNELFLEANQVFASFACENYRGWVSGEDEERPFLSWNILDEFVFPHVEAGRRVYFIVVDCLRLDQWLLLEERVSQLYRIERSLYCGAVPSSTLYARNALFAGKPPSEIAARYKDGFREESGLGESLNRYEEQFLSDHAARHAPKARKIRYYKFANPEQEKKARKIIDTLSPRPLTAFVFNFIDTVTHESGRGGALDALAPSTEALPRLALTWYLGSPLEQLLRKISEDKGAIIILTSDHGSTLTDTPAVVFADKDATKTPRYWVGRDLRPEGDGAFLIRHPEEYGLPGDYLAKTYVLAQGNRHLVFSHHLREYHRRFEGGFYHGGVSLPELVLPVVAMTPK
jgi:DNA-binding response OmpR family regulator